MQKLEARFQSALNKWWIHLGWKILPSKNYHIEAKVSRHKSFNYRSGIKSHQTPTLIAFNTRPIAWKISDAAMTTQLCDAIFSHPNTTYGVFAFHWIRPKNKTFFLITPDLIQNEIVHGSKSLTEERAKQLAFYEGQIK